jgi:CRISPR/Cas system-associated endonuclease Cas1
MRTMFVFSNGEIHRKDNTVMFDDGQSKRYLPIHEVDEMMVFGEVTLNKRFLEFCTQQEIIGVCQVNVGKKPRPELIWKFMLSKVCRKPSC